MYEGSQCPFISSNITNKLNVKCFSHLYHMGFTIMHKILLITLAGTFLPKKKRKKRNKSTKFRVILRQRSQ